MALPNPSMSFSPFAILTAEELNDMVDNIESLANGTGFDDAAISAGKTSIFSYQTDNSNTIANVSNANVKIQSGWGQKLGVNSVSMNESVTFPTPFSTVLGVIIAPLGISGADSTPGASISDFETSFSAFTATLSTTNISNSGFTAHYTVQQGYTFSTNRYYAYSWIAWGV